MGEYGNHAPKVEGRERPDNPDRITKTGTQTCQLVSFGRSLICMRCGVRRGRGSRRSLLGKLPAPWGWREPRANWTVRRSPMKSEPSWKTN
jgi:hypothetical protein